MGGEMEEIRDIHAEFIQRIEEYMPVTSAVTVLKGGGILLAIPAGKIRYSDAVEMIDLIIELTHRLAFLEENEDTGEAPASENMAFDTVRAISKIIEEYHRNTGSSGESRTYIFK